MFRALTAALLAMAGIMASNGTATAVAYPTSNFYVCFINNPCRDTSNYTSGVVTWYNRTVNVSGSVFNSGYYGVSAVFDAFQGSTKVDSQARGAGLNQRKSFGFDLGDTTLPGGVDRVRITLCVYYSETNYTCGEQKNYLRIGS